MKKIIGLFVVVIALISCNSSGQNNVQVVPQSTNNNIQLQAEDIPGFNVQAFANLVKTTANPQLLEQQINNPNSGINTLDLDKDGNIDYLKIVEKQNQLIVVDETPTNQITIATLNITPNGDVSINGVQTYCGPSYYYHNHYSLGDALLLSYLLRPHPYYIPRYHYGYYPSYYHRTSVISTRSRIISRNTTTRTIQNTRTVSNTRTVPNTIRKNPIAPQRTSISNPTNTQKAFVPRQQSTPVRSGGFGNSSSKISSSPSSFGGGSRSFGGGSFGGGSSRSFGGGSSRSFGGGSRSFGGGGRRH